MEKTEEYYLQLLLQCLLMLESSVNELDKKLTDSVEMVLTNNQLLGFLAKTLNPMEESSENSEILLSVELSEELTKHSAELEIWGRS